MSERDDRLSWLPTGVWLSLTVGLYMLGGLLGIPGLAFLALFSLGLTVAKAYRSYQEQVGSGRARRELEADVAELRERLAQAESEIARLREEADFDRRLMGGRGGPE